MRIGIIDEDGHNFPNIALMKLSAWHKQQGDTVEWYNIFSGHVDRVYMAKVFNFTIGYQYGIQADEIIKGGTGYCIETVNGKEIFRPGITLPDEIEHTYPDYSLYTYKTKETAYGYLSRGCPRGCGFCHVAAKEGKKARKVADIREFWDGQEYIKLLDPNILAVPEWEDLIGQLAETGVKVDFTQGLDIRLLTAEKAEALNKCRIPVFHFAWDRDEDLAEIFRECRRYFRHRMQEMRVYVLTNYDTSREYDLYRIYTLRDLGYDPFVMVYDLKHADSYYRHLQRWSNNKIVFRKCDRFENYWYGGQ